VLQANDLNAHPYGKQIRMLLQAAMLIFVYTVVIGILNGTDLVEFGHATILTHVHTGTLGWITTSVLAASLWMFGGTRKPGWRDSVMGWLPVVTVLLVIAYNIAFGTTHGNARPAVGALMLLAIVVWLVWIFGSVRDVVLSTPRLAVLAAIVTAATGGLLGVLLGAMISTGNEILPGDAEAAHPATMVIGFLVPIGMALSEWYVRPETRDVAATRPGKFQVALPFIGGFFVTAGLLADSPPLISVSLPFEIIGVTILVVRLWPGLMNVKFGEGSSAVLAAPTVFWLVANIVMFIYLIGRYQGDFDDVRVGLILALYHMMFIGVLSNSLFAQVRSAAADVKPVAVQVLFWLMNVGLAGFVLGLIADVTILKQIFTPIMGLGILHGVVLFSMALQRGRTDTPVPAEARAI
jgi:hypothetical protein